MAIKKSELYSSLWAGADALRGGMDASQYKDYVLVLLFLKYVSDKAEADPYALIEVPKGASFKDVAALKGSKEIGELAKSIQPENKKSQYPPNINTPAKQAMYEILEDEALTLAMEADVAQNIEENFIGNTLKERKVKYAIRRHVNDPEMVETILEVIKNQKEYR